MNLKGKFSTLGIILLLSCVQDGNSLTPWQTGLSTLISLTVSSNLQNVDALPPRPSTHFFHRSGPPAGVSSAEDESDEDDNESQARVEPQITPLNRDECLAKLLCGMSVPVTGGGAPKDGYYSQYANIVAKFFEAFPLEEEEKSIESIEAYDDYSVEDDKPSKFSSKPARLNSKKKHVENDKSSNGGGLQLIDLGSNKGVLAGNNSTSGDKIEDDERTGRSFDPRLSRARKIVAKLGEKLQTVRECQKISGCPFTFKQLRSKLKTTPTITSNVQLDTQSIKYNYNQVKPKPKPRPSSTLSGSTELTLGQPIAPYKDTHKGDDEIEEFFGPPPVFGANKRPVGYGSQRPQHSHGHQQYYQNQHSDEYIPYDPPVRGHGSQNQGIRPAFPKKKVNYVVPSFVKRRPQGDNDEFDDVNQSTGPVNLIEDEPVSTKKTQHQHQQRPQHSVQQTNVPQAEFVKDTQQSNDNNGDDDDDYNDDDDDDDYDDDNEEDEEEESNEDEEEEEDNKKTKKKAQDDEAIKANQTVVKSKIKNYKNPTAAQTQSLVFIEEEFGPKKPSEDDELEHPDNAWTKLAFATSGALIKEPKNKNKTALEEKNDEKLNLSKGSEEDGSGNKEEETSKESEEEDEDEDDDARSRIKSKKESDDDEAEDEKSHRRKPSKKSKTKLVLDDEDEFEKVSSAWRTRVKSKKPKRKSSLKSRPSESENKKKRSGNEAVKSKDKKKEENPKSSSDESDEEQDKRKFEKPPLLQIGGRPLVPSPEKNAKQSKLAGGLSRFNFNLVRPYGAQTDDQFQASVFQKTTRTRGSIPFSTPDHSYKKPVSGPSTPSFKKESIGSTHKESYLPSVSFGASNGAKVGNVEFLSQAVTSTQKTPSMITFPFGSPLTRFTSLFKRPSSSSQSQDIPGSGNHQHVPTAAFVHRPVGPESNSFRRESTSSKSRSDNKKKSKTSKYKNNHKKSGRY